MKDATQMNVKPMTSLDIRPAGDRSPVHPDIDPQTIARLVDIFYGRIREHPRLGPIFESRLAGRWPEHIATMNRFWNSVLLKTGTYKGRPVPAHLALKTIKSDDYGQWLALFRTVAHEVFREEAAAAVIAVAERIAESLWLATFGFPGIERPEWLSAGGRTEARRA